MERGPVPSFLYRIDCRRGRMREIKKVFVAGSGTMGMSIAQAGAGIYDYSGDKAAKAIKERDEKYMKVCDAIL